MAYSTEDKERIFKSIISEIENGASLRSVLSKEGMPARSTFFEWLKESEEKSNHYAKSIEARADSMFDEMLEIAYTTESGETVKTTLNGIETTAGDMLGHRKLKIDTIKWILSRMNPKKFGDKMDMTTGGEKLNATPNVIKVKIIESNDDDE